MAGNLEISGVGDAVKQYGSLVLKILLIVVIVMVVWKVYKSVKAGTNAVGEELSDVIVSEQTGIPAARIEVCKQVVEDLYNSYKSLLGMYNVDEDAWINALNRLAEAREVALVSQIWRQKTSFKTLKTMVDESFSASERQKLKPFVITNLS